jgi:FixJ family two-component response regulator
MVAGHWWKPKLSTLRKIYIAVVEDDESVCRSFARLLRAASFEPVTYPSGEAFLGDAKHPTFDCLLVGIQLGGMSGLELGERLAAVGDVTPVVYNTEQDEPELRAKAEACSCAGYCVNTDAQADILAAIARAVGLGARDSASKS